MYALLNQTAGPYHLLMDVFHTLAEISVAITGFSSLIIILRGSSTQWSREDYLSFGYVLSWSVGCIFLSLLPILLVELGFELVRAAGAGLIALPAYLFVIGGSLGYARSRIVQAKGRGEAAARSMAKAAAIEHALAQKQGQAHVEGQVLE